MDMHGGPKLQQVENEQQLSSQGANSEGGAEQLLTKIRLGQKM